MIGGKIMKKILAILLVLVLAIGITACNSSGAQSASSPSQKPATQTSPGSGVSGSGSSSAKPNYTTKYTLNYATPDAQKSLFDEYLIQPMKNKIEKYSGGRITFEPYYSSTLAGQGAILTAVDSGSADAGGDAPTMYKGMYLYAELANTPGIDYGSMKSYSKLINDYAAKYPDKGLQKYYMISRFSAGLFGFCTTKKPVETPASSKGLSFRATGNVIPYVEALGATGTMIPLSELYESLRLNVVDGAITTLDRITSDSYYDVCGYFTPITWFFGDHVEVLSMNTYNKMDPEAKAAIDKCKAEMMDSVMAWHDHTISFCEKTINDKNPKFKFIKLEGQNLDYYVNAAAGVLKAKVNELNAAGLDGTGAVEWLKANANKYK